MGTALITGATSGIGWEFARQLAGAGHNLVLVARNEGRLQERANSIRRTYGVDVEVLAANLGNKTDLRRVCERLEATGPEAASARPGLKPRPEESFPTPNQDVKGAIGVLVNAAGFGLGKPFLDNSVQAENYALDVMVRAVMDTSHAAGRSMRQRRRGTIINVSSVAADSGMGTYSAHKAWVRAFSEGLAEELRESGVRVTAMVPGLVRTEFHQDLPGDFDKVPSLAWSTPKTVVAQTIRAAGKGKVVFVPTLKYRIVAGVQRHLPHQFVQKVIHRFPHT